MTTRNTNAHFELAPQAEIERSTMMRDFNVKTSFNVGDLIPFYVDEVLPGDTFEIETSKVARLQTLITPVMDNLYLDTYYFFVPNRLVWKHWQDFCGENNTSHWTQPVNYHVPQIKFPNNGFSICSLADYMGLPVTQTGTTDIFKDLTVNALPFRAYCKIVNDWFRDENLQDPLHFYDDETLVQGVAYNYPSSNDPTRCETGSTVYVANKYHDYFTSCLPEPQKGPFVTFFDSSALMPIYTAQTDIATPLMTPRPPLRLSSTADDSKPTANQFLGVTSNNGNLKGSTSQTANLNSNDYYPTNLYASFGDIKEYRAGNYFNINPMNINQLREAFQVQRMLEKDARGGTRYIELLKTHFGVTSPDARLQRAEYLGGNRVPFNIEQVVNTTGNQDLNLVPGETSGWSQTNDVHKDVQKSFVEHGYVIGLMVARYDHTYQENVERHWRRLTRYDYYWPALAHLGEQAVYKPEMYFYDKSEWNSVFGYQEAWAEYRYKPNMVTGTMRTHANQNLDVWHFADNYQGQQYLDGFWIQEDFSNVNRALVVQGDENANGNRQVFVDVLVKNKCTRPMPLYSIPGLIDHF